MRYLSSLIVLLLLVQVSWSANLYQENTDIVEAVGSSGVVNYSRKTVRAEGLGVAPGNITNPAQGRIMAYRAAEIVARRNLLEAALGVRIDSETLVENFVTTSDVIKSSVRGFVRNSQVVLKEELADGSARVVVEMPISGSFSQQVLGSQLGPRALAPIVVEQGARTGVIFNATGLGARPCLSPQIHDEEGRQVYGSAFVDPQYAIETGVVGYEKNVASAQKNDRVAGNPLVIKVLKVSGKKNSNLVISNADATRLRKLKEHLSFFRNCRVIIVL